MKNPIADTKILMKSPNGDSKSIHVKIGLPYLLSHDEAACPISMTGLYPKIQDIHGIDTLQALALAFEFIRITIRKWEEKGFTFEFPQGGKLPPEIWFGQKIK
jgi:hypothetical protein